ncbi:MAG TPA: hypothetical protein VH062_15460 [Polyangiaceae bacterium]|jgi:hypothetical protein|nr:hypothetical protein [Polyangiaceae bacterium]
MNGSPILAVNNTILWLKVILTAATIIFLYFRYRRGRERTSEGSSRKPSFLAKALLVVAVVFSFGVYHNLGNFRGGGFVHVADMFNYYLNTKYFNEVGYFDLYDAVLVADTEQGNQLAGLPFYTDLRTYQNVNRERALQGADRIRSRFSSERWRAFKEDVAFFKTATGMPRSTGGLMFLLMDHGYNGSPVTTLVLGTIANIVPLTKLQLLAYFDVFLMLAMSGLVFHTFGLEMGAVFSVYFCVNVLNAADSISGCFLRYDWLFYIVVAVCLLERKRYASSAFFLTLSAMLRVFPAALLYGMVVIIFKRAKRTGAVDKKSQRFILAAGVTGAALFLLPAVYTGTVLQPWSDFSKKIELHDRGVYVNHLGFRGIALFESDHLSLERFYNIYASTRTPDIVRHWQNVKEAELKEKRPIIAFVSLIVLICLSAIIWKRESETEAVLWPLVFVYTASYPAHYYYGFLCLFILLFFKRPNSLDALVPLCLLLSLNIAALLGDYGGASPIVFYTLINIYLFACFSFILVFELYRNVLGKERRESLQHWIRGTLRPMT